MKNVKIEEINLKNSLFHFSQKHNIESIEQNGLVAQIGDASQYVDERAARVYLSEGYRGILAIKNSFLYKMLDMRICDIPERL